MNRWVWVSKAGKLGHTFSVRLSAEHTRYSGDARRQWTVRYENKRGQPTSFGMDLLSECTVGDAVERAVEILASMGAKVRVQ